MDYLDKTQKNTWSRVIARVALLYHTVQRIAMQTTVVPVQK